MKKPKVHIDPAIKFLPIRFRTRTQKIIQQVYANGRSHGSMEGKQIQAEDYKKSRPEFKDALAMTVQRLGDANAQIATQLARILERL